MRTHRYLLIAVLALGLGLVLRATTPLHVASGTWVLAGQMSTVRTGAASVLLPDGRIMIIGGTGADGNPLATTEFFNTDGTFTPGPSMSTPRTGHAASWLLSGEVVVTGGTVDARGSVTNAAEVFDPLNAGAGWTTLPTTMLEARSGHTMTALPDGTALIAGGVDNSGTPASALEILEIAPTEHFAAAGALQTARKNHAAVGLNDGRVLIVGGTDAVGGTLASSEIFDPATAVVSAGPALKTPRTSTTATTLLDGRVLIAGGSYPEAVTQTNPDGTTSQTGPAELASMEIYDPASGTLNVASADMSTARSGHKAFLLPDNNNVLILGGTFNGAPLGSTDLYIPWTDQLAATPNMSVARTATTGTPLSSATYPVAGTDGILLVAGGEKLKSAEMYGFATVKTDRADYLPGDVVTISGNGWKPREIVTITIHPVPSIYADITLSAVADDYGTILNSQFSPKQTDVGLSYFLSATGSSSQAQNKFADGNPQTTIAFPVRNASYNVAGWNSGCAPSAGVCGTAKTTGGATITKVEVALQNSAGKYWDGTGFTLASQSSAWRIATLGSPDTNGKYPWVFAFAAGAFTGGSYTVYGRTTDSTNATDNQIPSTNFTIDTTAPAAPSTPALAPASNSGSTADTITSDNTPTFTGTADANTTVTIYSDGGQVAQGRAGTSGSYSLTASTLADGTHNITATSTDDADNVSAASGALTVTIDTVAPTVTINQATGQADPTGTSPINFTVLFSEPVSDFATGDVTLSGTAGATTASVTGSSTVYNVAVSGMNNNGTVIVAVPASVAHDSAGNPSAASTSTDNTVHFTLDNTPPTVTVSFPAPVVGTNGWYGAQDTTPVVGSVTATDTSNVASITCSGAAIGAISGQNSTSASATVTVGGDGTHNVSCTATDGLGNTGAASGSTNTAIVKIDTTSPTIAVSSRLPAANGNGWNNSNVTVTWSCIDALSGPVDGTVGQTLSSDGANQSVTGSCADKAGNTASDTQSGINIDKTPPTITGSRTPDANSNGWNNTSVTVKFTCGDDRSGIDSCTPETTLNTDGGGQSVTGMVTDKAGNTATATVSGISIDTTPPVIGLTSRTPANTYGWNNNNVAVNWSCADAVSGPVAPTITNDVSGEGENQSTTGTCTDLAGNTAKDTQAGINIDRTPPTISGAATTPPNANGWYNSDVTVHYTYSDGLSGIDPTSVPADSVITGEGNNLSASAAVYDKAGNKATVTISPIQIDRTAPTITYVGRTPANTYGWNNNNVAVNWSCADAVSGPVAPTIINDVTGEGENQSTTGTCTDLAGNTAKDTQAGINVDKTPPTISGAATTPPNANGWYNSNVTVHFTCGDTLSGMSSCGADATLSSEASGQSATGTATDKAGNTAKFTVSNINIDKTPPTVACPASVVFILNQPNASLTPGISDSLSGPASATPVPVSDSSVGSCSGVTLTGFDLAGNSASQSCGYVVSFGNAIGFFQPWAAPPGTAFKAGSTIPLKWQWTDYYGNVVDSKGVTPNAYQNAWCPSSPTTTIETLQDSGASGYQYDSTTFTWQYNWKTPKAGAGYCYALNVKATIVGNSTVSIGGGFRDGDKLTQLR